MELVIEQIKISKALRITAQTVGHGNRSTLYEWMRLLKIVPNKGTITRDELARICVFGKAVAASGSKRVAVGAMLNAKERMTREEFFEFAFCPSTTFEQVGAQQHAS